jgi:hypothetical protein
MSNAEAHTVSLLAADQLSERRQQAADKVADEGPDRPRVM